MHTYIYIYIHIGALLLQLLCGDHGGRAAAADRGGGAKLQVDPVISMIISIITIIIIIIVSIIISIIIGAKLQGPPERDPGGQHAGGSDPIFPRS